MNADTEKRNKDVRDKELRDKARAEEARAWTPNPDPSTIVIPGLDTTAPISAQLEYVEQMITLRMQDIDSNFAKIHRVLINRLLPAVKKYAQNSQPTREAASFWKSFFEAAAQVKVTVPADLSSRMYTAEDETEECHEEEEASSSSQQQHEQEEHSRQHQQEMAIADHTPTDHSFMTGAVSSTPLPPTGLAGSRRGAPQAQPAISSKLQAKQPSKGERKKDDPRAWAAQMQSPFAKLHHRVRKDLQFDQPVDSSVESAAAAAVIAGTPAAYKLLRTPAKEAVRNVVSDILGELRGETPSPSISGFESHVSIIPPTPSSAAKQRKMNFRNSLGRRNRPSALASGNYIGPEEDQVRVLDPRLNPEVDDFSDEDDSFSDERNPPPPPPLFAGAREEDEEDDSFAHSDDDSDDSDDGPEDGGATVQPHPLFAAAGLSNASNSSHNSSALRRDLHREESPSPSESDEDHQANTATSTLFGRRDEGDARFRIMGDVMDTYHGGRLEDSEPMVASPTPGQGIVNQRASTASASNPRR